MNTYPLEVIEWCNRFNQSIADREQALEQEDYDTSFEEEYYQRDIATDIVSYILISQEINNEL